MKIFENSKINMDILKCGTTKPVLYQKSTDKFWDDDYISMQMLNLHLNPDIESASKTKETIEAETKFIINSTDMNKNKKVVDLGCGPGLYVRGFSKTGAEVTGIDISCRSIDYAKKNVEPECKNTRFLLMNYLEMDFENTFDIATLIFYDFCPLSTDEQNLLLKNIHRSLKSGGYFVFDIVTENRKITEGTNITVNEKGGFWSPKPYVEIVNTYSYDTPKTEGIQFLIIEEDGSVRITRLYHRLFSLADITDMLNRNNFKVENVCNNLKGDALTGDSETYGIIARKVN